MSPTMLYALLFTAIGLEVAGTSALQMSQQFTRPLPTLAMILCYVASFYCLSHVLRTIPVGLTYAIWSGLGIVLISAVGYFFFRQTLDLAAIIGLGLIIAGVLVVNLFSNSISH
ncbi:multidrug efflux SMR transporter [Rhizobium sp. YJ-22]|uniref:DMT family transporter n=1 Tax=Rhizobium sp. YJ-22 TaxID=3037556 RepID=UPI002412BED2|nr:multidrug efflux SMR transporter [Rhizobium sp. YJ-22]MDG3576218.1 multidrug efflux SMR transporter [Rhizobium sp. YJ-22]